VSLFNVIVTGGIVIKKIMKSCWYFLIWLKGNAIDDFIAVSYHTKIIFKEAYGKTRWYVYLFFCLLPIGIITYEWFPSSDYTPNIITELFSIFLTVTFLSWVISHIEKDKSKREAYDSTANIHGAVSSALAKDFIIYITKKNNVSDTKEKLYDILTNIDSYIDDDFLVRKIRQADLVSPFYKSQAGDEKITPAQHTLLTKDAIREKLHNLAPYISLMPKDLSDRIMKIDSCLYNISFLTAKSPISERGIIGYDKLLGMDRYKEEVLELGTEIFFLLTYFDEFKNQGSD
jgi:hypothetical protein